MVEWSAISQISYLYQWFPGFHHIIKLNIIHYFADSIIIYYYIIVF